MNQVAQFEKVSFEQFKKDCVENGFVSDDWHKLYDEIQLPKRATKGSAGYDFYSPLGFELYSGHHIVIPTGIRCNIEDGWFLSIYPRSGLGFKHHVRLANSVGIIDSDYYHADNEGHIIVKLVFPVRKVVVRPMEINSGDRFCQGVFLPYGITHDDHIEQVRYGGFGSTGEQ